jgi:hypothetical protein
MCSNDSSTCHDRSMRIFEYSRDCDLFVLILSNGIIRLESTNSFRIGHFVMQARALICYLSIDSLNSDFPDINEIVYPTS